MLIVKEQMSGGVASTDKVNNVFSHIATIYDLMNALLSLGLIRYWRARAAEQLDLLAGEVGLDLGTGTVDLAIAIIQGSPQAARMIGIDMTREMLVRGEEKLRRLGLEQRIELRLGDAERLELPDNCVAVCCSAFMVRNLADLPQSFREMLRVVRPGGRVVCLEVSHPANKLLRVLFHGYFYYIAPLVGLLLGQRLAAYQYLPGSLRNFPDAPTLQIIMEGCGWRDVHFQRLHGGLVAIHIATKQL